MSISYKHTMYTTSYIILGISCNKYLYSTSVDCNLTEKQQLWDMPVCAHTTHDMWIGTSFQRLNFKGTRDVRVDIEPKQVGSGNERSILPPEGRGYGMKSWKRRKGRRMETVTWQVEQEIQKPPLGWGNQRLKPAIGQYTWSSSNCTHSCGGYKSKFRTPASLSAGGLASHVPTIEVNKSASPSGTDQDWVWLGQIGLFQHDKNLQNRSETLSQTHLQKTSSAEFVWRCGEIATTTVTMKTAALYAISCCPNRSNILRSYW